MRITSLASLASLAGWAVGVLAGTVGDTGLVWLEYSGTAVWQALTLAGAFSSVVRWALVVAMAILPCSLLVVALMVFRALGRASFWGPLKAAGVGGAIGVAGLVPWWLVVSFFTTPINWSRAGEDVQALGLFGGTVLLVGATVGCVATLTARSDASMRTATSTPATRDPPPPVPYEY